MRYVLYYVGLLQTITIYEKSFVGVWDIYNLDIYILIRTEDFGLRINLYLLSTMQINYLQYLQEMQIQMAQEERLMRIHARKNFMSQRSVSYQSSFESRPAWTKRSFGSNQAAAAGAMRGNHQKASSSSPPDPRLKVSLRPQSAKLPERNSINFIRQNIAKTQKVARPSSGVVAGGAGVESRLKYSRNYQAPRKQKKSIVIKEPSFEEDHSKPKEDYEADFESDEYEEDLVAAEDSGLHVEKDEAAEQREAWLVEQAARGRARQRALMNR